MNRHDAKEIAQIAGMLILVAAFFAAVWFFHNWNDRRRAAIYADEFQRRGMAPQAVPK